MVRAGEGGFLFEEFKIKKIIAIGWGELGDLSKIKDSEMKEKVKNARPDRKEGYSSIAAGQIIRFKSDFGIGEYVITYDPMKRVYLVGKITGDYMYDAKLIDQYPNIRKVEWLGEVSRDKLSVPTKNTLGAISTIFDVGKDAQDKILNREL